MKGAGIYKITCFGNNKFYIGSTYNLNKRKTQHFSNLRCNRHTNKYLQSSFNKYGEGSFSFEVIQVVKEIENIIKYEQEWIDNTRCYDRKIGFNQCRVAEKPFVGRTWSEEHRKIIRERNSGSNNYWYGKKFSEQHRKNLSEAHKNIPSPKRIPIIQLSLEGEFIKKWSSALEASKTLILNPSLIWACLHKKRNKHGNFKWIYEKEYNQIREGRYV